MTGPTRAFCRLGLFVAFVGLGLSACTTSTTLTDGQLTGQLTAQATTEASVDQGADPGNGSGGNVTDADDAPATDTPTDDASDPEPIPDEPPDPEQVARLASLADDCRGGSDLACDILFQISPFASDDEALALDCGGRGAASTGFCTDGIVQSSDGPWFDDASDGVGAIVDLCVDGDFTACDFLYYRSAIDSTHESIGTSCGDRVAVAVPDCRTALGDS